MYFEIVGTIEDIVIITIGGDIRDIMRLRKHMARADGENLKDMLQ